MEKVRIIFMGTPDFAVTVLEGLINSAYLPVAVVSQPDKPVGRKKELKATAVKQAALNNGIAVLQPQKLKSAVKQILAYEPELIITCAYGQMVPEEILNFPKYGCINVHASLLPKLRGGAPIHKAIMYGEKETGITIMKMAKKMDAGDIFRQESILIARDDTMGTLHDKLKVIASKLLIASLPEIISQKAVFVPQNEAEVTFAYNVSKEEEFITFNRPYIEVYNHIRSLIPIPVGYGLIERKKYKFQSVTYSNEVTTGADGEVLGLRNNMLAIAVSKQILYISEIQPEGRQTISARDFFNGAGKALVGKQFSPCNE